MNRDAIIYSSCTFLLGLVIGSLLIGPHLKGFGGAPPAAAAISESPASAGGAPQAAEAGGAAQPPADMNTMNTVREQLAKLKDQVARDPRNFDALAQLGEMYMDAAKFTDAIQYFEKALAIREDANVRIDLGICYKQNGQLDRSLATFERAAAEAPDQWQPLYNEAVVLGDMKRFDQARSIVAKLKAMRPGDADVQKLDQALANAR